MYAVTGVNTSSHREVPYVCQQAETVRQAVENWYLVACENIGADPDAMPGSGEHEQLLDVKAELERNPPGTPVAAPLLGEVISLIRISLPPATRAVKAQA